MVSLSETLLVAVSAPRAAPMITSTEERLDYVETEDGGAVVAAESSTSIDLGSPDDAVVEVEQVSLI
ncbi:MAG: hypothetical protein ACREA0_12625 [bacterium]